MNEVYVLGIHSAIKPQVTFKKPSFSQLAVIVCLDIKLSKQNYL